MPSSARDSRKLYAIVIGLDSLNGIQTARILARRGIPVIAKDRELYGCRTRLCERILFADTASETSIKTLETLGQTLAQKAVLFPCTEMTVLLVSRYRQRLRKCFG